MFLALVFVLLIGYPVAFSLAANGLIFGFIGIELGLLKPELLQALPERIFGIMRNDTLLAIPFFTFMGLILERSGGGSARNRGSALRSTARRPCLCRDLRRRAARRDDRNRRGLGHLDGPHL